MKKIITLGLLLLFGAVGYSQGTLQFNRVLLVDHSSTQTVPVGKVWKVEAYWQNDLIATNSTNSSTCNYTTWHSPIIMNGKMYYLFGNVSTGYSALYYGNYNKLPFWAPAGTTLKTVCDGNVLSVIEFNIVP